MNFTAQMSVLEHNVGYKAGALLNALNSGSKGFVKFLEYQDTERERHSTQPRKKKKVTKERHERDYHPGRF